MPLQVKEVLDLPHRIVPGHERYSACVDDAWPTTKKHTTRRPEVWHAHWSSPGMGGQGRGSRCAWQTAPRPRTCCCICTCLLDSCAGHNAVMDACVHMRAIPNADRNDRLPAMGCGAGDSGASSRMFQCGLNIFRVIPVSSDACTAGWSQCARACAWFSSEIFDPHDRRIQLPYLPHHSPYGRISKHNHSCRSWHGRRQT